VGQRQTQRLHVEDAWTLIRQEADRLSLSR